MKKFFDPSQFVPTKWDSAADKASFGDHFLKFALADFPRNLFNKKFYSRLCQTFGHIAYYDLSGFYSTWFEDDASKLEFLKHTLRHPCYGDPAWTYSDIERAIQIEVSSLNLIQVYTLRADQALRDQELRELERLQKKYTEPRAPVLPDDPPDDVVAADSVENIAGATLADRLSSERTPVQARLF